MKPTVLRFGLYAAALQFTLFVLLWLFFSIGGNNYGIQEVIGYTSILVCLSFAYFGVRYYRDKVNGGAITFFEALKLALLIVILPAIAFALTDTFYVMFIDPHFYEKYAAHMVDDLRKTVPPAQFAAKIKEMKAEMDFYQKPYINFIVMFLTVAACGIIVSLISALVLCRKRKNATVVT